VAVLVMEARGQVSRPSFGKLQGPGTKVEEVSVGADPGYWVSGAPHGFFFYELGAGRTAGDTLRLSGDALIWNRGRVVLRIESAPETCRRQPPPCHWTVPLTRRGRVQPLRARLGLQAHSRADSDRLTDGP